MASPVVLAPVVALVIAGTPVPLSAFKSVPKVIDDVVHERSPQTFMHDLIPVLEGVSDAFLPGSGLAEQLVLMALGPDHPMTPQEEKIWMDRFSIQTQK